MWFFSGWTFHCDLQCHRGHILAVDGGMVQLSGQTNESFYNISLTLLCTKENRAKSPLLAKYYSERKMACKSCVFVLFLTFLQSPKVIVFLAFFLQKAPALATTFCCQQHSVCASAAQVCSSFYQNIWRSDAFNGAWSKINRKDHKTVTSSFSSQTLGSPNAKASQIYPRGQLWKPPDRS